MGGAGESRKSIAKVNSKLDASLDLLSVVDSFKEMLVKLDKCKSMASRMNEKGASTIVLLTSKLEMEVFNASLIVRRSALKTSPVADLSYVHRQRQRKRQSSHISLALTNQARPVKKKTRTSPRVLLEGHPPPENGGVYTILEAVNIVLKDDPDGAKGLAGPIFTSWKEKGLLVCSKTTLYSHLKNARHHGVLPPQNSLGSEIGRPSYIADDKTVPKCGAKECCD